MDKKESEQAKRIILSGLRKKEEEFIKHTKKKLRNNASFGSINKKYQEKYQQKNNKLRWDLAPWNAIEKIIEVITEGAKEENYGIDNWKTVSSEIFDAAMIRHYVSYKKGERYDKRWMLTHLAHLACNAVFLLWKELLVIEIEKRGILKILEVGKRGELKSNEASKEKFEGGNK